MSYAAKGEQIFSRPDPAYLNCTPAAPKRSDHRLKRFQSTFDRRAWDFCDEVRYRHLYDLMSGSQTCLNVDQCHKYVPLEDLIRILMAEKDELIRQLQERLRQCCQDQGDSKEKELLQNQIAALTEEVNKSRDMLRQAMHKLENIDEIVNENKKLQCRLRCSEERVKFLEEKKKDLESELADLRSKSQIQTDLEKAQQMLKKFTQEREEFEEMDEAVLHTVALEKDELQEKVKQLEKELEESRKKETEIERLKNQTQSDSLDKEEMSRENECYRRKLASMKCLEKQIQELKKQGRALADKYKREAQKAAEQVNKMCMAAKELQCLREERDSLRKRVNELASYESQYNKLCRKLQRVDAVIAENENLNSKLCALQKLEEENEYLRCKIETIKEMEMNAVEDKERIMQLECAVADQEEEMKDLLCQIERLTSGKHEEELERLKCELYETNSKLKLCEEQLAEIPMLEAEIDELRTKLQCCCREFSEKKRGGSSYQQIEVRFPATSKSIQANYKTPGKKCSSVIGIRREEKVDLENKHSSCQEILQAKGGKMYKVTSEFSGKEDVMTCEEVQSLLESSKGIISCVLEDMIEHQKEMEELEMCNKTMKEEIERLKEKVGDADKDCMLQEINRLKNVIETKDMEISRLQQDAGQVRDGEDIEMLKTLNKQMKDELEAACAGLKQVANLEKALEMERRARCEAERKLRGEQGGIEEPEPVLGSSSEVKEEDPNFDCCKMLQKKTEDLKLQIDALNKLTEELKKENELLRELQQPCPDFSKELEEKCALENLLSLLQAELDAFKGQRLSDECEALRSELKRVMEQNCQLKTLVDCYRQRLDLEKKSNELNQIKLKEEETVGPEGKMQEKEYKTLKEPVLKESEKAAAAESDARTGLPGSVPAGRADSLDPTKNLVEKEKGFDNSKSSCEDELKALRANLSRLQQENENLKHSLKEAEERFGLADRPEGEKELLKQLQQLKNEKDAMSQQLQAALDGTAAPGAVAGATAKETADCMKELEQLKKEKNELAKQLADATSGKAGTADAATGGKVGTADAATTGKVGTADAATTGKVGTADAATTGKVGTADAATTGKVGTADAATTGKVGTADAATIGKAATPDAAAVADCMKELEQLRKEKNDLSQKLAEATEKAAAASAAPIAEKEKADCLKELEQLRKEKNDWAKQLAEATSGKAAPTADKDKEDLLKELEQLKKEKNDLSRKLAEATSEKPAAASAAPAAEKEKADFLKELEQLRKEKNDLANQLQQAVAKSGVPAAMPVSGDLAELQERLRQMEAENAEKLKKLMDQHEKELADRDKTYNENLNAMKSGYETDIRKLAERHKQSIMRLQELHEDEVQELNLNYEAQLDTMQTQSEAAINDVAKGSVAKVRKLNEQHSKVVSELEKKFHTALDEKESEFLEKLGILQGSLTKSQQELETLRKREGQNAKRDPSQLKAQHAREIQKIRKTSMQKINAMKDKFDEERKKSEAEIESLKKKLKDRVSGDGVCECNLIKKKPPKPRDPTCPLDFNEVLEKILEEGLESLTFNEIALVHGKTCCALEGIVMKSNESPVLELEPPVGDGCSHVPLLEADKQQLLSKIFALEEEILQKQRQTQEDIISMEVAIKKERCRLQEVRSLLEDEQQKNTKLKLLLNSQTKIHSELKKKRDELENEASIHQLKCEEKTKQLDEEMRSRKCLEAEVEKLRNKLKQLCTVLDAEKGKFDSKSKDQLELMRIKLEQSVHQERRLALQLENEAKYRMQLQCQLQTLRQSFKQMVNLPAVENDFRLSQNPLEAKSAKEKQNFDQVKEKKNKTKTKFVKKHKK